jgi:hypothetical protein
LGIFRCETAEFSRLSSQRIPNCHTHTSPAVLLPTIFSLLAINSSPYHPLLPLGGTQSESLTGILPFILNSLPMPRKKLTKPSYSDRIFPDSPCCPLLFPSCLLSRNSHLGCATSPSRVKGAILLPVPPPPPFPAFPRRRIPDVTQPLEDTWWVMVRVQRRGSKGWTRPYFRISSPLSFLLFSPLCANRQKP